MRPYRIAMNLTPEPFLTIRSRYLPLLHQLEALFGEMNKAYGDVAGQYRFQCNGCADNCCRTRFYHHTLLEYLYLVEGLRTMATDLRQEIGIRALAVNAKMAYADRRKEALHIMCPLNRDERCLLYAYRPMICRLHGIPHELHRPNGSPINHPGCDAFYGQCRRSGKTE